jgi:hypothetical protein
LQAHSPNGYETLCELLPLASKHLLRYAGEQHAPSLCVEMNPCPMIQRAKAVPNVPAPFPVQLFAGSYFQLTSRHTASPSRYPLGLLHLWHSTNYGVCYPPHFDPLDACQLSRRWLPCPGANLSTLIIGPIQFSYNKVPFSACQDRSAGAGLLQCRIPNNLPPVQYFMTAFKGWHFWKSDQFNGPCASP